MAVAVRAPISQEKVQRPSLVATDRRPYRCGGKRCDVDGRPRICNQRVGDVEGDDTLVVTCGRCGQEHAFSLQTTREKEIEASISMLLALLAFVSYDDGAAP